MARSQKYPISDFDTEQRYKVFSPKNAAQIVVDLTGNDRAMHIATLPAFARLEAESRTDPSRSARPGARRPTPQREALEQHAISGDVTLKRHATWGMSA